jgi:F0F1-type ATP synthase membrane subunit b/b'
VKRILAIVLLVLCFSLTAFANEEGGHHEIPVVYKWVNFGILAAGLVFLAFKVGGPFFAERAREITVALDAAGRVKAEAEAQVAEITKRIANLDGELAAMKAEARREMEKERERSRRETEELKVKAQAAAEQEISSAVKHAEFELRRFTSQLSLRLAEEKIRTRMNNQVQAGLVGGFVASLSQQARPEQRG